MADTKTERQNVKEITDILEKGLEGLFEGEKPVSEPDAKQLLSTAEGVGDFKQAITRVSPVPVGFEDIPGEANGYYIANKRIAVQKDMGESRTLKTMVHEIARAVLHDKELNHHNAPAPAKYGSTKEAEGVAYTVCRHFGIDTSDHTFGHIAGWSAGRGMTELKSFLDTVRGTASEMITGIESRLKEIRIDREMRQEQEKQLLNSDTDKYGIYQLKDGMEFLDFHFMSTRDLWKKGRLSDDFREIRPENYNLVYTGELSDIRGQHKLAEIFIKFNAYHPEDFKGHSLSVSDIVVLHEDGKNSAHFVDSNNFTKLPAFIRALESEKEKDGFAEEQEMTREKMPGIETDRPIAFYRHSFEYAVEHGETDAYRASYRLNEECRSAIEETIRKNFDGMHLKHDIERPLAEQYGSERMAFILASTVRNKLWDGRFSRDNRRWSSDCLTGQDINITGKNRDFVVNSHSGVLDVFITAFRREVLEREKEKTKMQAGQGGSEQPQADETALKQTVEISELEDGDELIDLGDEMDQVLADLKKSIADSQDVSGQDGQALEQPASEENPETELAFQIADRFVSIQETDGGYDYSIIGADYKVIDGGVYDNPDVSIREALEDIVSDLQENNALADMGGSDGWMPMDYDGLMEKVEAAERIEPQMQENSVVENFRAKTNEMFHTVKGMKPADFEEIVKCHVQAEIDENFWETKIVEAVVVGSRCRGLERDGSDIDVVVELATEEREDSLFNAFNEDGLRIAGIRVDINPITAQKTGTLETYLPQAEEYLTELRKTREKEQDKPARPSLKARIAEIKARTAEQGPEKKVKNQEKER